MPIGPLTRHERKLRSHALLKRTTPARPVWVDDDGGMRLGHSSDVVEMLEAFGQPTRS